MFPSEKIGIHNLTSFSPEKALLADVWAEILQYSYKGHNGSLSLVLAPQKAQTQFSLTLMHVSLGLTLS